MKQKLFRERLADLIKENNLTNYRLAQVSEIPAQSIGRYLAGEVEPKLTAAQTLATVLDEPGLLSCPVGPIEKGKKKSKKKS